MKRTVLLALLAMLATPGNAFCRNFILRAPGVSAQKIAAQHGLRVVRSLGDPDDGIFLVSASDHIPADRIIGPVRATSGVKDIEPDTTVSLPELRSAAVLSQSTVAILDALNVQTSTTFAGQSWWDQYFNQPATRIINLAAEQQLAIGGGTVAIIDTGIDPTHSTLANAVVPGYDFTRNQGGASEWADVSPKVAAALSKSASSHGFKATAQVNQSTVAILDQSTVAILDGQLPPAFGHGTSVAGLIHRVAPAAKLMPLKAFSADGTAQLSDILRAIRYAAKSGVKVINLSFNLSAPSQALFEAISFANSNNVIIMASAGNAGLQTIWYPAGWTTFVAGVASTTSLDTRSTFSNYGDAMVTIAAPGENLITTYPGNNYAAVSGTSFSTALVSGASALFVGISPKIVQSQATAALRQAVPIPGQGLGAGRLDVYRACAWVLSSH
jgi:subtilisin family serine protease